MHRRALVLSGLGFALLLAATLLLTRDTPEPDQGVFFSLRKQVPDTLIVAYGPDSTVLVPGGRTGWTVIHPVIYPADGVVVEAMLRRLQDLHAERRFPLTREKMDTYGMRISRARIYARYGGGVSDDSLTIGSFTLNDDFDYVRPGQRPEVGVVDARIVRTYLLKSTLELRDTRLLPFAESRVDTLELYDAGSNLTVQVVRQSADSWRLAAPYDAPVRTEQVINFLRSLNHMHIHEFVTETPDYSPQEVGLNSPQAATRITTEGGEIYQLQLGKHLAPGSDRVYAQTRGEMRLLGVSEKYLWAIQVGPGAFLEPAQVPFGLNGVDSVVVIAGTLRGSLLAQATPDAANPIRDTLGNWLMLDATRFSGPADPVEFTPAGRLLWMGNGALLAEVEVGVAQGKERPVRVFEGLHTRPGETLWFPESRLGPLWDYLVSKVGK